MDARQSRRNQVLTLHQAAGVLPGLYMPQPNILGQGTEEWNAVSEEHRDASDDESLNEPRREEPLDGDPAIHVDVPDTMRLQLGQDSGGVAGHPLNQGAGGCRGERMSAQDIDRLLPIGPCIERQNRLVSIATDDQCVHACHERLVAMLLATTLRKPIQASIRASNESIEAGPDEDGCPH